MARVADPASLLLYHQFGLWLNPDPSPGTHIDSVAAPFLKMDYRQAEALWQAVDSGKAQLPGQPDIVHSNSFLSPAVGTAKLVYTVHDLCFWTHPEHGTERNRYLCQSQLLLALERAAGFHFISQASRDDFEAMLPGWLEETGRPFLIARSGLRLHPSAVPDPAQRFADPNSPWLFVGTIEPRKNLSALLDAYQRYYELSAVKRPLELIGAEGWRSQPIHQKIDQLATRLPIRYLGRVDDDTLKASYARAFAHLSPSHHEGFGLTILEALAYSLPTLASPNAAAREFGARALSFTEFEHPQMAADAMLAQESDLAAYTRQAAQARESAAPYSWENTARALLAFYETLL